MTGATIARCLSDAGKDVLVLERRHLGGNVHDSEVHGIRIHTYGPHYFRTNNERIWAYVQRFADFWPFEAILGTFARGQIWPWPPTREMVGNEPPGFTGNPRNFEEASLAKMPRWVYESFVKGYTEKQWGVPAASLDVSLAKRFAVSDGDRRLKSCRYQGIPIQGYTRLMENMLDGIPVEQSDYRAMKWDRLIYTGAIDEYFGFDLGGLKYRSQDRRHSFLPIQRFQPFVQVNNSAEGDHIRTIEWNHLHPVQREGTVITREYPYTPEGPGEYPFPDAANAALYARYRTRANRLPNVTICGRLGEYRYYDMDQAIGRALVIASRL